MVSVNQPTFWNPSAQAATSSPTKTSGAPGSAGITVPMMPTTTRAPRGAGTGFPRRPCDLPLGLSSKGWLEDFRQSSTKRRLCSSPSQKS